jgi:hydrogenase maturation factor
VLAISDGELVEVDVSLVPAVHAGDLLLVHAGLALTVLDEVPIPIPERTG